MLDVNSNGALQLGDEFRCYDIEFYGDQLNVDFHLQTNNESEVFGVSIHEVKDLYQRGINCVFDELVEYCQSLEHERRLLDELLNITRSVILVGVGQYPICDDVVIEAVHTVGVDREQCTVRSTLTNKNKTASGKHQVLVNITWRGADEVPVSNLVLTLHDSIGTTDDINKLVNQVTKPNQSSSMELTTALYMCMGDLIPFILRD